MVLLFFLLFSFFPTSFAEKNSAMITFSDQMKNINFDGKWTSYYEWKESSLNEIGESLKIRSAHYENFVYIFVDVLHDSSLDIGSDRTTICFDTSNNKSKIPDSDDYCFIGVLERESGFTLQGGGSFATKSFFNTIPNHDDLIVIGAVSDQNDRYSKQPHPSYEFKIPTDLIGRSDHYGFYVESFDAKSGNSISWPSQITKKSPIDIPGPQYWGDMISIDKSLPEFPLPFLIFTIFASLVILLEKYRRLHMVHH